MEVADSFAGGVCKCDACGGFITVPNEPGNADDLSSVEEAIIDEPGEPSDPARRERPERPERPDLPPAPPRGTSHGSTPTSEPENPDVAAMAAAASGDAVRPTEMPRVQGRQPGQIMRGGTVAPTPPTDAPRRRAKPTALFALAGMILVSLAVFVGVIMWVMSDDAPPPDDDLTTMQMKRPATPATPPTRKPAGATSPTGASGNASNTAPSRPAPTIKPPPATNASAELLAHWPLDGGYKDQGPDGLKGTAEGEPKFIDGTIGKAAQFNGKNRVVIKSAGPFGQPFDTLSVAAWVKMPAGKGQHVWAAIVSKGDGTWRLSVDNTTPGRLYFAVNKGSPNNSVASKSTKLNDGKWHHLVGTFDHGTMKLYVDGKLQGTNAQADKQIGGNGTAIWISGNSERPGRELDGAIDDVRLYRSVLGADDVEKLYDAGG
ncbi:MAG: hypothetical protein GC159_24350 [Phycisphaera sp.]|nr:hypothetical protein [Phycisphaera sp.]